MKRFCISASVCVAMALAGGSSLAQVKLPFGLDKVLPGTERSSAPASPADAARDSDAGLLPVKPNASVENELKPDLLCRHFEEKADVWQKLADYGGLEAQLRMKRLLATDFRYSDLTPQDKQMLKYVSYTTVWVPPSIESGFGKLYASATSGSRDNTAPDRDDEGKLSRARTQMQAFKSTITDFPGGAQVLLDKSMKTGAYAQVGGIIVLSRDFLNRMDEKKEVQHLVLAHELSHLYKRHTIKEMQYQLVTSESGFGLAKKLLSRFNPDAASGPLALAREAWLYANAAKELLDWVREHQVKFGIDQELEADACSVVWMTRSNLDPKTLPPVLAELEAVQSESDGSYARTHPTSKQRQDNLLIATGQKAAPAPTADRPTAKPPRTSKSHS